jgi:tRNA(Arg) A34 adenosine deaminase TadA
VVCRDGQIVCEAVNSVRYDRDVTRHAELVALSAAFRRLNRTSLEDCTIYSNAEPCALCCYAMRESRIGRVVYSIPAPLTGGVSRWRILADDELSDRLPEVFAPPPEIVPGFMRKGAEKALARPAPLAWGLPQRTQHLRRPRAGVRARRGRQSPPRNNHRPHHGVPAAASVRPLRAHMIADSRARFGG